MIRAALATLVVHVMTDALGHVGAASSRPSRLLGPVAGSALMVQAAAAVLRLGAHARSGLMLALGPAALVGGGLATAGLVLSGPSIDGLTGLAVTGVTHVPRRPVPAADLASEHEPVRIETDDGLTLAGWYLPSVNGAAVPVHPGRGHAGHARMLVRHGYGVLMVDQRGQGDSDGEPNAVGWHDRLDVAAALSFLQGRDDVDPRRIDGLGLSVGGEALLQAAAESPALAAVVSEGAGVRSVREVMLHRGVRRYLDPACFRAAEEPEQLWHIPESGHIGGLAARPDEYGRRVVGFFETAMPG